MCWLGTVSYGVETEVLSHTHPSVAILRFGKILMVLLKYCFERLSFLDRVFGGFLYVIGTRSLCVIRFNHESQQCGL